MCVCACASVCVQVYMQESAYLNKDEIGPEIIFRPTPETKARYLALSATLSTKTSVYI